MSNEELMRGRIEALQVCYDRKDWRRMERLAIALAQQAKEQQCEPVEVACVAVEDGKVMA